MDRLDKIIRGAYGIIAVVVFALTFQPAVGWMVYNFVSYERRIRPAVLRESEWGLFIIFLLIFICLAILGWMGVERIVNKIRTP